MFPFRVFGLEAAAPHVHFIRGAVTSSLAGACKNDAQGEVKQIPH